nr:hypothetical protein [Tanacetum cinerariifolium]
MSSNAEVTYSEGKVHPSDDGSQPRTLCKHGFRHVRCEVQSNKEEYRIFKDHTYMIELDGATFLRKASVKSGGFVRYPFQLIPLSSIELTDNKYLIDKLYQSSGSSTQILDDLQIHALHALLSENSEDEVSLSQAVVHADYSQAKEGTVKIDDIRSRKRWNFPCCGGEKFLRFRLELDVSDKTASTVVVMFDEPAKELLKCSADSLAAADDESGFGYVDHAGLPLALASIIGTTHTLEMKSHTYYEHGTFESFMCWRIAPKEVVDVDSESSNMNTSVEELEDSDDEVTSDMDDGGAEGKESSLTDKKKENEVHCG